MEKLILGIETSCDETAAAIYSTTRGILSNKLFSQITLHQQFGGVIPELASRSHLQKISTIIQEALDAAFIQPDQLDAIAVTNKPGLPGSLLVGVCFAKSLAYAWNKPLIGVNHLEGHVFSALIENQVPFPHVCLTASGGHTSMYRVNGLGDYQMISQTRDDAAGEAFDKIAKLIDLPYPGGPVIEQLASQVEFKDFFHYPRGSASLLDFSFSGLKTAVLYDLVKRNAYDMTTKRFLKPNDTLFKQQVASSLLVAIADIFVNKVSAALELHPDVQAVTFVGGVACNAYIRSLLEKFCKKKNRIFLYPRAQFCTDNGAMIAFVGGYKLQQHKIDTLELDILR